jgi:hypothetical protein
LQDPPKLTQIGILGLKTNHLATLFKKRAQKKSGGRFFQVKSFQTAHKKPCIKARPFKRIKKYLCAQETA